MKYMYMPHLQIRGERGSVYGKGYIAMAIQEWGKRKREGHVEYSQMDQG